MEILRNRYQALRFAFGLLERDYSQSTKLLDTQWAALH